MTFQFYHANILNYMRKIFGLLGLFTILLACETKEKTSVDVSSIKVNFSTQRFDQDFYKATAETLPLIKNKYPLLFPQQTHDSVWVNKINNKDEQELYAEVQKEYPSLDKLNNDLLSLFKHIKYYNPNFKSPGVITMLTNIDYDNRVTYTNTLLLISLDAYLGATHEFYNDYPDYVKQNNTANHIIVDVANAIINRQMNPERKRTFLAKMITAGKRMYLLDAYLPEVAAFEKIGYSQEKYHWATMNEEGVWRYFIEHDLLYSTDSKLNKRFLDIAPFSKFYLEDDASTPGQIGVFIGWQIVKAYMENNDVSLQRLMQTKADEILKKSKYKPRK